MNRKKSRLAAVAVVAAVVTALAACGSSSPKTTNTTSGSGTSSSGGGIDIAGAKATIAKLLKPTAINYNPGPLGGSVAGKTIGIVGNITPSGRHSVDLIVGYAKELQLNTKVYNAGSSAEQLANAMDQVLTDVNSGKVNAVLLNAFSPNQIPSQYAQLQAKKIPVGAYAIPDDPTNDTLATVTQSPSTGVNDVTGYVVDWMIQDQNGPVNAVVFAAPALPILKAETEGFKTNFNNKCPASAGCKIDESDLDLKGIGTTMPGAIVSYLQGHPNVKYAFVDFGDMLIGVPAAIKAAGISGVKFVSLSANADDVANLKAGTESANFAFPFSLLQHVVLDALSRAMLGKSTAASKGWKFPTQLMTPDNISGGDFNPDGTANTPGVTEFFKGIWSS
jgi:ribose transport system substrate-binding protein